MQLHEALNSDSTSYRLNTEELDLLAESIAETFQKEKRVAVAGVLTIDAAFSSEMNQAQMSHGSLKGKIENLAITRREYLKEKLTEFGVCTALTQATPQMALRKKTKKAA